MDAKHPCPGKQWAFLIQAKANWCTQNSSKKMSLKKKKN